MKFLACSSVTLFYFLCFAEAVPESKQEPRVTALTFNPSCGSPGIPELTCSFLGIFIAFVFVVCKALGTSADVSKISACLVDIIPVFGGTVSSIFNGIVLQARTTAGFCPGVLFFWNSKVNALCPGLFNTLNRLLAVLLFDGKGK